MGLGESEYVRELVGPGEVIELGVVVLLGVVTLTVGRGRYGSVVRSMQLAKVQLLKLGWWGCHVMALVG